MGRLGRLNRLLVKIAVGILLTGLVMPAVLALLPAWARTPLSFWITSIACVVLVVLVWSAVERAVRRGAKPGDAPAPPEA